MICSPRQRLNRSLELEGEQRKTADAALDKRVADLVSAIGDLIAGVPPENLR